MQTINVLYFSQQYITGGCFNPSCAEILGVLDHRLDGWYVVVAVWGLFVSAQSNILDGLVQDCSNSIALAMELLQSCTKP